MRAGFAAFIAVALVAVLWASFAHAEEVVKATGTIEPVQVVDVNAHIAGIIETLGVDPENPSQPIAAGTRVKKGTVLAKLDSNLAEAAAEKAKADLNRAVAELTLAKAKLALAEQETARDRAQAEKTNDSSSLEIDKAKLDIAKAGVDCAVAGCEQSKVALKAQEQQLDQYVLRSPIDGILLDCRVRPGQLVTASPKDPSPFIVGDDSKFQVWASISESDIGLVTVGQPVRFTVSAIPNEKFTGRIAQIRLSAVTARDTVTYTVVIDVDKTDKKLLPYQTAEVQIVTKR